MTHNLSNELRAERLTVCAGCEQLRRPIYQCKLCGCFMRLKVLVPAAKCPAGKW
jgi:hypothetical protein